MIRHIVIPLKEFTLVALKTSYIVGGACELSSAPFFTVIPYIVIPHTVIPHIVNLHIAISHIVIPLKRTHIGCT